MFNKLFAVCLLVDDFEKSLDFYKNILGLEINSNESKFANFKLGETELAIFQKNEAFLRFLRICGIYSGYAHQADYVPGHVRFSD